jgi:elongator complex protein 3
MSEGRNIAGSTEARQHAWMSARCYSPAQLELARAVLADVRAGMPLERAVRARPQADGGHLPKHLLVHVYRSLIAEGEWLPAPDVLAQIRMKPVRTLSGVTTITVLTAPYACPGKCLFCPTEERMPKSYLADEPGAMRALQHAFDPWAQVSARLEALQAIGHPTQKVELLILGGTWSAYPRAYQSWFVQRCLEALNGEKASGLAAAQTANEGAPHRNVGLSIETRPDCLSLGEIAHLRRLGVTKVQLGAQSCDDRLLELNRRGHTLADTQQAMRLLRAAGLKIVLHWMPNLLGATPETDRRDFARLWALEDLRPDELKIYPTQLLPGTGLAEAWARGEYVPYTSGELVDLLADLKPSIPRYCRVNRVVRDIPSHHVLEGSRRTSLRQDVLRVLSERGQACSCIRCREVRSVRIPDDGLQAHSIRYAAAGGTEHFLSFDTANDRLAGYLRLWLPGESSISTGLPDLAQAALIREVHVYGPSLPLGDPPNGAAQHTGVGARLVAWGEEVAMQAGFRRLAIIAALGTRPYYQRLGYRLEESYMLKSLGEEADVAGEAG